MGEGLQVTNCDKRLHTVMVIWKCTDVFRGFFFGLGGIEGKRPCWKIFSRKNMSWGKTNSIKGGAGFSEVFFWIGGDRGEGALWEDLFLEEYVMGEYKFNEGGRRIF